MWPIAVSYFLPTVIAKRRDTNNFGVIFGINSLFGWTVLGWIVAYLGHFRTPQA